VAVNHSILASYVTREAAGVIFIEENGEGLPVPVSVFTR
jgi:hypothetical protein